MLGLFRPDDKGTAPRVDAGQPRKSNDCRAWLGRYLPGAIDALR